MSGPPDPHLSTDTARGDVIVVDAGGTNVRLGHLRDGEPARTIETSSSDALRVDDARAALAGLVHAHAERHALAPTVVVMGMPGMLDRERDTFDHCNNIPRLEGTGLRRELTARLGCPVLLEQDIMLQLLGEHRAGAARDSRAVFAVYFGTGIGAAYLQDGDPFRRGASSLQAGHIPMLARGTPCLCGNRDCVEAHACGHTLTALAASAGVPTESLFTRRGDSALDRALDEFVMLHAWTIATAVTLLQPDDVLLGGGIVNMDGYPLDTLKRTIRAHLQRPRPADTLRISRSTLAHHGALHGALALIDRHTRHRHSAQPTTTT